LHLSRSFKLFIILLFSSLLFVPLGARAADSFEEAAALLPDRVGEYQATGRPQTVNNKLYNMAYMGEQYGALASAYRDYSFAKGGKFYVVVTKMRSDSGAYSFLTMRVEYERRMNSLSQTIHVGEVGTASVILPKSILFFKGPTFVEVSKANYPMSSDEEMLAFARSFAESLDKGDGDIPVLVKHLPDWENIYGTALYAVSSDSLRGSLRDKYSINEHSIIDAISFEGGTEAVAADYGPAQLLLVEYTTPQIATDSDTRINARIKELQESGQPVPSAYRRVGNYSVFVFDAPDEQTAAQLINGVSYEQVVQWLGDNPHALERAQRAYTQTTAGIILAVIKASGLSLLLCLGVGGLFGAIIFRRRRAQQAATAAYSDAGDMIRLNIDDMTPQSNPARLLGRSDS
jgi:hypothetical protein